ncbi:unnamed protein product [Larinioides sclopetarius]|uniref:Uncharacterized protein n=1 Tax=Larinioides sclopetarius TaxID=280406 RepID=A0AAV2A1G0_9ARAC
MKAVFLLVLLVALIAMAMAGVHRTHIFDTAASVLNGII